MIRSRLLKILRSGPLFWGLCFCLLTFMAQATPVTRPDGERPEARKSEPKKTEEEFRREKAQLLIKKG
ncbi:MAG TPA: hypothetical protein PKO06_13605, partial [Candidatus Ozemobacteraceae bacterium]|nr:hypothetical protein [Candidatus Ozemobacteraceae bacterium]